MQRKDFLKGAAALTGASLLSACRLEDNSSQTRVMSSASGPAIQWNMVTTWPPNFPVLGEGCQLFADLVASMSGGRLRIRVYGGGELVPPLEAFDNVSAGTVQLANGSAYYWAGKVPAAQFFASVPFGLNAQQMNAWILRGGGQALWDELYAPFNIKPFVSGNTGVQMGGWFNREINRLSDLQGLKIRMPGLGGKVITAAGATAANLAGQEIYTNLERGVIDATEWIGPYHDYLMGFHKVARYYYYPGWHETGTVLETMVNKQAYEALPEDLREILRAAIAWHNTYTISEFEAKNSGYLRKLIEEEQVQLRKFPDEVIEALRQATDEVIAEVIAQDEPSRRVYEAFDAFRRDIIEWSQYSEATYHELVKSRADSA